MPEIFFYDAHGAQHVVDVACGETVMRGALDNMIDGMVGECGGGLACATCHCVIDEAWIGRVGSAAGIESEMLEVTASKRCAGSRLGCQIVVTNEHDGLIVRLPEAQY